jgi:hypothetical protein
MGIILSWLVSLFSFNVRALDLAGTPFGCMYFAEGGGNASGGEGSGGEGSNSQKDGNSSDDSSDGGILGDKKQLNTGEAEGDKNKKDDPYKNFKVADGVQIDDKRLQAFIQAGKEFGITPENLNKAIKKQIDFESRQNQSFEQKRAERLKSWASENATFLGTGKDADIKTANIARALDAAGTDVSKKVRQFFTENGIDSHPTLVRLFEAIGAKLADEKLITGSGGVGKIGMKEAIQRHYEGQ